MNAAANAVWLLPRNAAQAASLASVPASRDTVVFTVRSRGASAPFRF